MITYSYSAYFSSGDPHETEVDTILLLTDDRYLVADYDSSLDKIVQFQKVPLDNITEIEIGLYQHQTKMFQGSIAPNLCLRLNYTMNGEEGYFHMFRSPNIRFFNNVAVVIKTKDEISGNFHILLLRCCCSFIVTVFSYCTESLMAIVEFFRIALESGGKSNVKITTNAPLTRKRSKIPMLEVTKVFQFIESKMVKIN